jgi:TonB family protein
MIRREICIASLLIIFCLKCFGKNQDTVFYKSNWEISKYKSNAKYYRIISKSTTGGFLVKDYYLANNQLQMAGNYSQMNDEGEIKEGLFTWYDSLGTKTSERYYEDGKLSGISKEYDSTGVLILSQNYLDGLLEGKTYTYFSSGKTQYEDNYKNDKADGIQNTFYKTGELKRKEIYKNGKIISGQCYTKQGEEAEYVAREELAMFIGGEEKLIKYIQKNLKYPKEAREKGESGTVLVKFIVKEDGSLDKITIFKSVSAALDKAAISLVKAMPNWQPGKMEGKAVKVSFLLPLTFALN